MERSLSGVAVFLSASVPEQLQGRFAAQQQQSLITTLVREVLEAGGDVVFGGHPTITPLVHSVGKAVKSGGVLLFQPERFRKDAPREVTDTSVFREVEWVRDPDPNDITSCLREMRTRMAKRADVAVFAGGKLTGYMGTKPGLRDEYELFLRERPKGPLYLIGMLGGTAAELIREGVLEPNTLQQAEADLIHNSNDIELIVELILNDIARSRPPIKGFGAEGILENFSPMASQPTLATVRFVYMTGVKRPFLTGARLTGNWDAVRRPSDHWTTAPMRAFYGRDGCPAFEAEVTFPLDQVGRTFRWGVRVDGPLGADVWGIMPEIRNVNSFDRWRAFDLLTPTSGGAQHVEYHLCHARSLGAQKDYRTANTPPRFRAGVWAPNARDVQLIFGTFYNTDTPGAPVDGPIPVAKIGGGYIADDGIAGRHPDRGPFPMKREGGFWFTGDDPRLASFAVLDHKPYMFLVTRDDGSVLPRTDLYSLCQAGQGRINPNGRPYQGPVSALDGRVSCSVVVDPDMVTREFNYPVWPEPAADFIPDTTFWANEFDAARPVTRRLEDLVIYELHVGALGGPDKQRDGRPSPGDFTDAIGLLDYLTELGVNAVELLPMAEFGLGSEAWGYGNSHHFAIEYRAGGRDKFKHFIRECHRRGIAVILDVVYNHYTHDATRAQWMYDSALPERNLYYWYEGHPSDYPAPDGGYVDNFSTGFAPRTHEEMVRTLFVSSAIALVEEFHIDGFRVDLTDALHSLNRRHADGAPVPSANAFGAKFLREWARTLKFIRPDVMLMAEDHTGWDRVTAPPDQGGLGFDAIWYSSFYHHLIGTRRQGADSAGLLARAGTGGDEPLALSYFAGALRASAEGRVVYHESHDEAGNSADSGRTMDTAVNGASLADTATRRWAEKRSRLVAGLSLLSAGTPMFLMGEEVAAAKPYRYDDWLEHREDLFAERAGAGARMYRFYSDLIRLRLSQPAFRSRHIDIVYVHDMNRVIAFRRWVGDQHFLVVASFNNRAFSNGYDINNSALPDGQWHEVFNSDSDLYDGDNDLNLTDVACWAGRFRAILPAAGFIVFHRR